MSESRSLELVVKRLPSPKRVDAYLADALAGDFSRQEIKRCLVEGQIFLNQKKARPSDTVHQGDRIHGEVSSPKATSLEGESIPLSVLYEDEDLLVIDKPVGLVVHPGAGHATGTLVNALLGRNTKLADRGGAMRPGIVHRLDKDTSGLLLVAKTNKAHRKLQAQFASRTLKKTYVALVSGRVEFEEGHLDKAIGRDPKVREKKAVVRAEEGREAHTKYRVLDRFKHATLLEVQIETGRTHQIRVHMKHLGHPVIGDTLYGPPETSAPRLALHASKIEFLHPKTDKIVSFESPIPPLMQQMIEEARHR